MKNVLMFAFLIFSFAATAQIGCLEGQVSDGTFEGEGLIGATVKALQADTIVTGTVTDFDGNFCLPSIESGQYVIEISYTGLKTQRIEVEIKEGACLKIEKELQQDPNITGCGGWGIWYPNLYRADLTSGGQTLTSDQIRRMY